MSELTKEKIYKSELIKAGATGNNNLERIRSLAGGGGGVLFNKEYYWLAGASRLRCFSGSAYGILGNKMIAIDGLNYNQNYENKIRVIDNIDDINSIQYRELGAVTNYATQGVGFVYGDRFYVVGGQTENHEKNEYFCSVGFTNEDVIEGVVEDESGTMPGVRDACAIVDGKEVFIFGGFFVSALRSDRIIHLRMKYDSNLGIDVPVFVDALLANPTGYPQDDVLFESSTVKKIGKYYYAFFGSLSQNIRNKVLRFEMRHEGTEWRFSNVETILEYTKVFLNCQSTVIGGNVYIVADSEGNANCLLKFNTTTNELEELYYPGEKNKIDFSQVTYPAVVSVGNKAFIVCGRKFRKTEEFIQELIQG